MSAQKRSTRKPASKGGSRPAKTTTAKRKASRRKKAEPAGAASKTHRHTQQVCSSTMEINLQPTPDDLYSRSASYLDVTCPNREPLRIALENTDIFIGRDDFCQIHLPLTNVSRRHARITASQDEYAVEDLESTNGTFINGVRISRCVLRNNDQIRIGDARIQFVQRRVRG
jgi:hypothetical protein